MLVFSFILGSPMDMAIIGVLAVLLFGDRLPQVMRALGQGMIEFKKGMRDIEEQIESAAHSPNARISELEQSKEPAISASRPNTAAAPRFEPPQSEPQAEAAAAVKSSESSAG